MSVVFDQMIAFAERRTRNKRTYNFDLLKCNRPSKLDYNGNITEPLSFYDPKVEFLAFDYMRALNIIRLNAYHRFVINSCLNKFRNQCRCPVICGKGIYGIDVGKIVYIANYLTKDLSTFYAKRYIFNWIMRLYLRGNIPWAEKEIPIRYKYYPYERYISTAESYQGPVGCNGRPLLTSFKRIDTSTFTKLKED